MTTRPGAGGLARALIMIAVTIMTFVSPIAVAAHAELATSTPADGSTVTAPFADPIVMTFTEAVTTASSAELRDGAGTVPSTTAVDGSTMTLTPVAPLAEGDYEVRWTSVADDGHVERGTFRFIAAAAATTGPTASSDPSVAPDPSPAPTSPPSAGPSQLATPVSSVSAAPGGPSPSGGQDASSGSGSGGDVLLPIVAGAVLVGALAVFLLRRRDSNTTPS